MYKVLFKEGVSWFKEPFQADEVHAPKGWDIEEFDTYDEALNFINSL